MQQNREIIHLDLDAFYCAVEEKRDPALRGKPFAVGGRPDQRGVVASCSYAARKKGVRSAMPMSQALRLVPELIVIQGHFADYKHDSRLVMSELKTITDQIEQISIDEAFIDVTMIETPAASLAVQLQRKIFDKLNLPCSLGVASNKLVAKIANDFGKSQFKGEGPPNALTVVAPGEEAAFLEPLPVRSLWGVGPKTESKLNKISIFTIGELASADINLLKSMFGKHGRDMVRRATGIDNSPISLSREAKSISQEITFARDEQHPKTIKKEIRKQARKISQSLINANLTASTVRIKIRWPDFTTITRQVTISEPTDDPEIISSLAIQLVRKVWKKGVSVRLIGVGVSNLGEKPKQLNFWDQINSGA